MPVGATLLADQPVGCLASIDGIYDTLRADIAKEFPHAVSGVQRVTVVLPGDSLALRVAKAIGALQPIENFPRSAENVAALLYRQVGSSPEIEEVRASQRLSTDRWRSEPVTQPDSAIHLRSVAVRSARRREDRACWRQAWLRLDRWRE